MSKKPNVSPAVKIAYPKDPTFRILDLEVANTALRGQVDAQTHELQARDNRIAEFLEERGTWRERVRAAEQRTASAENRLAEVNRDRDRLIKDLHFANGFIMANPATAEQWYAAKRLDLLARKEISDDQMKGRYS